MSGLNTSKQEKTANTTQSGTGTSSEAPWAVQAPFVEQGFKAASTALRQAQGAPKPTDFVAGFNPEQVALFKQMMGAAGSGNPSATIGAGNDAAVAGTGALTDALSRMKGWSPTGGVDSNIADASKYADNPYVSGMVDAAMRGDERMARETVLPGMERAAAAGGNINSSRLALRQGLVDRGLAEKRADIDANLRGGLYSKGLDLAEGARTSDNAAVLDAMKSAAAAGTGALGTGAGAAASGVGQQGGLFDIAKQGSDALRESTQAGLDNSLAKYQFGVDSPFAALNNFWNIIGGKSWGGTTNTSFDTRGTEQSTQKNTGSPLDTIGKIAGAFGAFMK